MMSPEFEKEIIASVLSGNTDAFEALVKEHEKLVYNLALRMVHEPEDASDMAQESFVKAFRSLGSFKGDSKFSVWLYRITANVCTDFLRSKSRSQTISLTVDDDGEASEIAVPDMGGSAEDKLMQKLTREAVRAGLDALPVDYRAPLVLREINGLSYAEIADALSLEEGTVKSRIFRARKKLCEYLVRDGNIPEHLSSKTVKGGAEK